VGIVYSQGSHYSDPQGRFSFNLPVDWKAAVPYDSSQIALFTYSAQQGNIGELIIMIEELPFSASIDQYAAAAEENGFKQLPGYTPGTQLPATIFGLSAIKKNFTFSPQTGLTLQAEAYMFISGNSAYTILLDVLPDYFAQVEPGFSQAMASFKVQSGVIPAPTPIPTPVPSGLGTTYTDPQGRFTIPIPAGSTTAQTTEIGVVLNTPDGVGIAVMYTLGEQYVQSMVAQIKPDHQFHGQSQLQAGNGQALVELYSKVNPQDTVNYATVVVTYPGTPFMLIITVPADKYNQAQIWITEMIKGVFIR